MRFELEYLGFSHAFRIQAVSVVISASKGRQETTSSDRGANNRGVLTALAAIRTADTTTRLDALAGFDTECGS